MAEASSEPGPAGAARRAGNGRHGHRGPLAVATIVEALRTSGIDVAALLNRVEGDAKPDLLA